MIYLKGEGGSIPLSGAYHSIRLSCIISMSNSTVKSQHEWEQNLASDIEANDWHADNVLLGVLVMGANVLIEAHRVMTGVTLVKAVEQGRDARRRNYRSNQ